MIITQTILHGMRRYLMRIADRDDIDLYSIDNILYDDAMDEFRNLWYVGSTAPGSFWNSSRSWSDLERKFCSNYEIAQHEIARVLSVRSPSEATGCTERSS